MEGGGCDAVILSRNFIRVQAYASLLIDYISWYRWFQIDHYDRSTSWPPLYCISELLPVFGPLLKLSTWSSPLDLLSAKNSGKPTSNIWASSFQPPFPRFGLFRNPIECRMRVTQLGIGVSRSPGSEFHCTYLLGNLASSHRCPAYWRWWRSPRLQNSSMYLWEVASYLVVPLASLNPKESSSRVRYYYI